MKRKGRLQLVKRPERKGRKLEEVRSEVVEVCRVRAKGVEKVDQGGAEDQALLDRDNL